MAWTDEALPRTTLALAALLLSGCTALSPRKSPLPSDGPTMTEIYRNHMAVEGANSPRERLPLRGADEEAEVAQRRVLSDTLNNRFERLPNPDLTMHVFPHLSQGRYPVPGYDTVFPMYETVHYALPGEVAPMRRRADPVPPSSPERRPSQAHARREARERADASAPR